MAKFVTNLQKTNLLMHGKISSSVVQPDARTHSNGYHHFYHNVKHININALGTYPTNPEVSKDISTAWCESCALLKRCGMGKGFIPAPSVCPSPEFLRSTNAGQFSVDYIPVVSADTAGTAETSSERLERLLCKDKPGHKLSSASDEAKVINAGLAATLFYLHEAHRMWV
jgi:hypothetical protein